MITSNNAVLNPIQSVASPYNGGIIAPPTINEQSSPDAWGFMSPNPLIAVVNIVGNIIELNSPTNKIDHIDNNPVLDIDITIIVIAPNAKRKRILDGLKIRVK